MKKIILSGLSACLLTASANVFAADVEVNLSPLPLIIAYVDLDVMVGVSDNITVGPVINMAKYTLGTDSISLFGLGARGEYFMDGRDVNSFYTAVEMTYGTISTDVSSVDCSLSNFDAVAFGGYAWRWDSGMSVKLGGGLRQTVYLEDAYACDDGSTEGVGFETEGIITGFGLDFTVGKSF